MKNAISTNDTANPVLNTPSAAGIRPETGRSSSRQTLTTPAMVPAQPSLEQNFRAFSKECVGAFMADVGAEQKISEKLVKAYILFRSLRHDPLMANLHKEEGLALPNYTDVWPDFTTYVQITFRLGLQRTKADMARYAATNHGTRRNRQTGYVAALLRLHVEFEENALRYKYNAEVQLLAYHNDQNGIEGARAWRAKRGAIEPTASGSPPHAPQQDGITIAQAACDWIAHHALHLISATTIIKGKTRTCPGDIQFDADGFGLVVAQQHGLRFFDVANDDLEGIVQKSAARLQHISQPALRAIAEVARTQLYPKPFAPVGSRLDPASAYCKWDEKLGGTKSRRHLLLNAANIILSPTNRTAGLVTIVETTTPLMPAGVMALQSQPDTMPRLEELLDGGCMVGLETVPAAPKLLNGRAVMWLRAKRDPGVSLYDRAQSAGAPRPIGIKFDDAGPAIKRDLQLTLDLNSFSPRWSFQASTAWFSDVRSRFLGRWFRNQGAPNRITRDENCRFGLRVDRAAFKIRYEIDNIGTGPVECIQLGGRTSYQAKLVNGGPGVCDVASADVARVFCALPDLQVRGNVSISGDDHLILIEFVTDVGKFKIGIPSVSLTSKGLVRAANHMAQI